MKIYYLFLIKLLSICFFIGGCFSSTSYKSATVEEGKGSSGLAVGISTMQYSNENLNDGSSFKKSRLWPSWEFFFQYGLTDSFGMGLKTNLGSIIADTNFIADAKFQYFDGEVLDMAFDLGIGTSSFPQIRDNETVYDTYNSIYPAAIFTLNFSDKFRTSLSLEHKKIDNSNPEGDESSASFNGGSINISTGKDSNFIAQTSYFTGKDFKKYEVVLRSIGFGFAFLFD